MFNCIMNINQDKIFKNYLSSSLYFKILSLSGKLIKELEPVLTTD